VNQTSSSSWKTYSSGKKEKKGKKKHFEMLLFCLYAKAFAEVTFLVKEAE